MVKTKVYQIFGSALDVASLLLCSPKAAEDESRCWTFLESLALFRILQKSKRKLH